MTKSDIIVKHKSVQKDLRMLLERPKDVDLLVDAYAPTDVSPHVKFHFVRSVFVPASCDFYERFDIAYQQPPYTELDDASGNPVSGCRKYVCDSHGGLEFKTSWKRVDLAVVAF